MKTLLLIAFALISSTMLYAVPTSPNEDTDTIYFGKPDSDTIWYRNIANEPIYKVKFIEEGSKAIIGTTNYPPKVLDMKTGKYIKELTEFNGVANAVFGVANTKPNIAVGSDSGKIFIADYSNGQIVEELNLGYNKSDNARMGSIIFTSDDKYIIATCGYRDLQQTDLVNNGIVIIDNETKKIVKKITYKFAYRAKFSKDNNYLFVVTRGFKQGGPNPPSPILVYSTKTWELIKTLDGHTRPIKDFDISPDGKLLVSCDDISDIRIWDLETLSLKSNFVNKNNTMWSCKFINPNIVVTGTGLFENYKLAYWDINSKNKIFERPNYQPNCLDLNTKINILLVGGSNRLLLLKNDTTLSTVPIENIEEIFSDITNELLRIKLSITSPFVILNITNVEGRIVKSIPQQLVINNEIVLNVNDLPLGIYFITVTSANYNKTYKLVRGN